MRWIRSSRARGRASVAARLGCLKGRVTLSLMSSATSIRCPPRFTAASPAVLQAVLVRPVRPGDGTHGVDGERRRRGLGGRRSRPPVSAATALPISSHWSRPRRPTSPCTTTWSASASAAQQNDEPRQPVWLGALARDVLGWGLRVVTRALSQTPALAARYHGGFRRVPDWAVQPTDRPGVDWRGRIVVAWPCWSRLRCSGRVGFAGVGARLCSGRAGSSRRRVRRRCWLLA